MKTVAQAYILPFLTVFGLTSCDNKTQTKTEQLTTTADMTKSANNTRQSSTTNDTTLNDENDSIYYPSYGLYGDNILFQGQHVFPNRQNSLKGIISNGKNVEIKITKIAVDDGVLHNTMMWYYSPLTNKNWTVTEFDNSNYTQKFSSLFGGHICDVMMLFDPGTFQIDYYENGSLMPTTTKFITVEYYSAELGNKRKPSNTIQYDNVFYPDVHFCPISQDGFFYDSNCVKQLLRTGEFHRDVVRSDAEEVKWFGLFKNDSGFYLGDTKIRTQHVFVENDCYDPEVDTNDKTGIEVQITNKDTCLILIPEFDFLKNHKILQADLSQYISKNVQQYPEYKYILKDELWFPQRKKNQIFPWDTVKFNYMGVDYKIYATGDKKTNIESYYDYHGIANYKLYLSANKNGQIINQLLIAQNDTREMISILFAGDIDGDGLLDFLIDRTYHYEIKILFLSKPAYDGQLLKVVGELRNPEPGCC